MTTHLGLAMLASRLRAQHNVVLTGCRLPYGPSAPGRHANPPRLHGSSHALVRGQGALHAMARRHESLRTRFVEAGGRLLQAVLPPDDPRAVPQLQRCSAPVNGNAQALVDLITSLSEAPFEMLGAGVPVRFALITCERGTQPATLLIGMHHVLRSVPLYNSILCIYSMRNSRVPSWAPELATCSPSLIAVLDC